MFLRVIKLKPVIATIIIITVAVLMELQSTSGKIVSSLNTTKNTQIAEQFAKTIENSSVKKLSGSVTVLRFHTADKYYIEGKNKIASYEKEFKTSDSNLILNKLTTKRINYFVKEANLSDNISYYLISPVLNFLAPLLDKFVALITTAFFLVMLIIMWKQYKGGGKYEVILPQNVSGSLDDLIGMEDLKKQVRPLINKHKSVSKHNAYNVNKTFNIMFSGPPGTGKTKFAGYLAKELNLPLIAGSGSGLETGLVGGGSATLEALHREAKKLKRCVVFLDEAQSLFAKRGGSPLDSKHRDDTPNTLLAILDGVKTTEDMEIIWIFASNFNEGNMPVDEAMMRRFKLKLDFRLPNKDERKAIFSKFIRKIEDQYIGTVNYNYLGEISTGLSPAHIETIVDTAALACSEDNKLIETQDLYKAFEMIAIGNTDRSTTANADEKRKLIGIHELGHFIVEFDTLMTKHSHDLAAVRANISVLKISTESVSKMGALGYVLSKQEEVSLSTLDDLEKRVKQLYGGVAAEEIFFGARCITNGSANDIQKATAILKSMIFDLGMYSNAKINYSQLNMTSKESDLLKSMEKKSTELMEQTQKIVIKYKPLIEYLGPYLFDRYVLQADELMDLVDDYYMDKMTGEVKIA
jgi:cell division protease FtsH